MLAQRGICQVALPRSKSALSSPDRCRRALGQEAAEQLAACDENETGAAWPATEATER
jgi:hypothetical protein